MEQTPVKKVTAKEAKSARKINSHSFQEKSGNSVNPFSALPSKKREDMIAKLKGLSQEGIEEMLRLLFGSSLRGEWH